MLQIRDYEKKIIRHIKLDGRPVITIDDIDLFLGFDGKLYEVYTWQYAGTKSFAYEESKRFEMIQPVWKDILKLV